MLETTRAVDIFLDYWIMYRKEEPYVPVLRSNQKDFKDCTVNKFSLGF